MRRREFIALVGSAVVAWPLAARAQEPGGIYRLGNLFRGPRSDPVFIAFLEGMRQYGFVEGQNLLDDPNGYELRIEQFAGHASEIVKQGVDLIWCAGDDAIRAAQQATKIIPILAGTEDMLGSGFVHSMAKPEGNTTGHSIMSFEMNGKRQEILMELLPEVRHMAALADTYLNRFHPGSSCPPADAMRRSHARAEGHRDFRAKAAALRVKSPSNFPAERADSHCR